MTLHKMRYTHACHVLAAKVHPKGVQTRLDHFSIAITMDIWRPLTPNMEGVAAAAVDVATRAAINRRTDELGSKAVAESSSRSLRSDEKLNNFKAWKGGRVV